jgi:DNA-directed RNA polymerase subunit F
MKTLQEIREEIIEGLFKMNWFKKNKHEKWSLEWFCEELKDNFHHGENKAIDDVVYIKDMKPYHKNEVRILFIDGSKKSYTREEAYKVLNVVRLRDEKLKELLK